MGQEGREGRAGVRGGGKVCGWRGNGGRRFGQGFCDFWPPARARFHFVDHMLVPVLAVGSVVGVEEGDKVLGGEDGVDKAKEVVFVDVCVAAHDEVVLPIWFLRVHVNYAIPTRARTHTHTHT